MTIVASTPYPTSRLQFVGEETDLGVKTTAMSLSPNFEVARWRLNGDETASFPTAVGFDLIPVLANPGGTGTIWSDGTNVFVGATPIAGSGMVSGSGGAGQVTYWTSASTISSEAAFAYNATTNMLTAGSLVRTGNGDVTAPSYSFTSDSGTGIYSVVGGTLGISTTAVLRWSINSTAVTCTVIGVFPAAASGASGYASVRMPHGTAPTTNLTNGDIWTTTTGLFVRINGGTVGPLGTGGGGGTITGTIDSTQIAFGAGLDAITGDTDFIYDSTNNQIQITSSSATFPAYSFIGEEDTGMFLAGANIVGFAANGSSRLEISSNTVTAIVPILHPDGTAALPAMSFSSDTNTGIYWIGADQLGVSTGGTLRFTFNTTAATSTLPVLHPDGSAAAPSVGFSSDTNTGLYWIGADQLGVSTGGTLRLTVSTTALTSTLPYLGSAGSAAAPSISFSGDPNTGLYSVGADDLGFSTGGTLRLDISTTAITSTLINILPAATTSMASERLPHGAAPSAPVDGDMWTTTAGLFVRINGSTVGPLGSGGGGITGAGTAGQVTFWTGTTSVGGDPGMVYDDTNNQLALAAGTAALPAYAIVGDLNTGLYGVAADTLGFSTGGTLRWSVSTTAVTSTLINILPASTTSVASARLPHGTAPTSPVDGDEWTTTAGLFVQINGVTVGPLSASGGVSGSGTTNQVTYWDGSASVTGDAGMVYDDVNNQLALAAGTAALPAYSIVGDLDTGIYGSAANTISVATDGTLRFSISATLVTSTLPFLAPAGTAAAPAFAFSADPNSGLYSVGADDVGISTGGTLRWDVSTTAITSTLINILPASTTSAASERLPHGTAPTSPVDGDVWTTTAGIFVRINGVTVGPLTSTSGTVTGTGVAGQVSYWTGSSAIAGDTGMVYDATNDQLALSAGTAALPAYAIVGDLNTGLYGVAADTLGFSTGGTLRLSVSTTAVTSTLAVLNADGAAATPSVSFSSDTNTGLYWIGADQIGVSTGGTLRVTFSTTGVTSTLPILHPDGSAAAPSISFSGDTDVGLYRIGANDLGFSTNGVLRLDISATAITSALPLDMGALNITNLAAATANGQAVRYNEFQAINTSQITAGTLSSARLATNQLISTVGTVVDGGGSVLTTGSKGFIQVEFSGTITNWTVIGNASGSVVFDIKRSTFAGFPTTTSIVGGGNKPTLSSAQNATAAVSGWTSTAVTAGDIIEFNIDSVSTLTRVIVELQMTRT